MKRSMLLAVCFIFCCAAAVAYAQVSAAVTEVIKKSEVFKTVAEKANYLIGQADAFYKTEKFQQAIETAQYVLNNLDKNSQPAKDLIEKAKAQMKATAQGTMGNVTNKLFGSK